ncbi:MAG: hypothetical protein R3262_10000, partial [Xanthomarina gelatinilytica]|nr:hypothetical protein [Xanthomarina gelatinilytica]
MTYLEVEDKIKNAKPIDFGNLINDVFELFKKIWLKGFITILLIMAMALGIIFVFTMIGLAPENVTAQQMLNFEVFYQS